MSDERSERPPGAFMGVAFMPSRRSRPLGRLIFGLVVITLGVLFTLDNLGVMDAGEVLRWWPVALIAYGLARLTGFCCRPSMTAGLLFTLIGVALMLNAIGYWHHGLWDLWPVVLVFLGTSMVIRSLRRSRPAGEPGGANHGNDPSSDLSAFAIWSGTDRKVVSQDFRGGDVTAIMGGHDIDLRAAKMTGGSATIELLVMMGGVDLRVPEDWKVSCEALPLMGGVEDHSKPPVGEPKGHLILRGLVIMGGVEIKN